MSRVNFHSQEDTVEVAGSERAFAGILCTDLGWAILSIPADDYPSRPSILRAVLPPDHYALGISGYEFETALRNTLGVGSCSLRYSTTATVEGWVIGLNTTLRLGSDPVKLMARMHGQCEVHGYVRGHNRDWLAAIIEQGRTDGLFRVERGWELVVELLRDRDDGPVVMSYSVCEGFPSPGIAKWQKDKWDDLEWDSDAWYDLPDDEQWKLAWDKLSLSEGLELTPDNWASFYFEPKVSAFELIEFAREESKRPVGEGLNEPS